MSNRVALSAWSGGLFALLLAGCMGDIHSGSGMEDEAFGDESATSETANAAPSPTAPAAADAIAARPGHAGQARSARGRAPHVEAPADESGAEPAPTGPVEPPPVVQPPPVEPPPVVQPPPVEPPPVVQPPPPAAVTTVRLIPQSGVEGAQRINFAVPLAPGVLRDAARLTVFAGGAELPAARRALASHADGSARSVQVQVDVTIAGESTLEVHIDEASRAAALDRVSVESTLLPGNAGPKVWALLDAEWLAASGVAGPQVPEADVAGTVFDAWPRVCNYERFNADSFVSQMSTSSVWLYDRGTVNYRGYARRGDLRTLSTAYRETTIYQSGITGTDSSTRIGVLDKASDLKYHYTQNLALHYLLTGDDRFRESAENVAVRVHDLWRDPGYAGGTDFWTERNAGFSLLAYVWAAMISDDRPATFKAWADEAVEAYLAVQETYPVGYTSSDARCFSHDAAAHDEGFGYFGCSPWMSAILADGLEAYALTYSGELANRARGSIVKLGRSIARSGRDQDGRPYYWMGVGTTQSEPDEYEEHWGESAYVVAMAWHYSGRSDAELKRAADELVQGFASYGVAPHMRSVNWQCRSAVGTPFYLR